MWRGADIWLKPYLQHPKRRRFAKPTDVMIAICDHFEPFHHTDKAGALRRIRDWQDRFPRLGDQFRDSDGHPPKQTFFYPIEQYDSDILNGIAEICRQTGSEVDIHLHHDNETEETLRVALDQGMADFARHDLLATDGQGQLRYGFIHGNWALDNSDPSGRNCGVQRELQVLRESGCFGDFTMPSAPHPTQTRTINQLYYAVETDAAKSHDHGYRVTAPADAASATDPHRSTESLRDQLNHLLLVQGPLGLNWRRRKLGVLPRLENADLTGTNPPTLDRLSIWLANAIHVRRRPDWLFVKLHTHGAIGQNRHMLLGDPIKAFHTALREHCGPDSNFRFHYVSAREMVNIIHAAEDGHQGNPSDYRHHLFQCRIPFEDARFRSPT